MSGFKGKTPVRIFDEDVLYRELADCHCFKYIAFKELRMPFRHTGVLLFFDNVPKYTINVRTAEDSWSHWIQSLVVAPGRTTVESADDLGHVRYVGRPVVHVITGEKEREAAHKDLGILLTPKQWYALLWQNCRDHVRGLMGCLDEHHPGVGDAARMGLRETHLEDWGMVAVILALVMIPIGIVMKR